MCFDLRVKNVCKLFFHICAWRPIRSSLNEERQTVWRVLSFDLVSTILSSQCFQCCGTRHLKLAGPSRNKLNEVVYFGV